jgi:hypothetical protein
MKTIEEAEFLTWARERGLALDPRYPQSAVLSIVGGSGEARFWRTPPEPERRPHFLSSLLELMGDWKTCFAWRHLGRWPAEQHVDALRINDVVEFQVLKGLGLPLGSTKVIEFARADLAALVTLLFSTTVFGWSVGEDLYVVPDHARFVLKTDHHEVVHVKFRDAQDVAPWVEELKSRGFSLPDELPDETFKPPPWMGSHERSGR